MPGQFICASHISTFPCCMWCLWYGLCDVCNFCRMYDLSVRHTHGCICCSLGCAPQYSDICLPVFSTFWYVLWLFNSVVCFYVSFSWIFLSHNMFIDTREFGSFFLHFYLSCWFYCRYVLGFFVCLNTVQLNLSLYVVHWRLWILADHNSEGSIKRGPGRSSGETHTKYSKERAGSDTKGSLVEDEEKRSLCNQKTLQWAMTKAMFLTF